MLSYLTYYLIDRESTQLFHGFTRLKKLYTFATFHNIFGRSDCYIINKLTKIEEIWYY